MFAHFFEAYSKNLVFSETRNWSFQVRIIPVLKKLPPL